MSDRKQALTDLMVKVKAGEYADQTMRVRAGLKDTSVAAFSLAFEGSLDAARALHEAVLPGRSAVVDMAGDCDVYGDTGDGEWEWLGCSSHPGSPARAWLLAILRALHGMEPDQTS